MKSESFNFLRVVISSHLIIFFPFYPGLVFAESFPSVEIGISDEIVKPGLEATLTCRVQNQGSFTSKKCSHPAIKVPN